MKQIRFTFKLIGKIFLGFFLFVGAYFLVAGICSCIPVNTDYENEKGEITIAVISNGVHTDIAVPVKNEISDWSSFVPVSDTKQADSSFQYVSFGWGDKGFYIETPTWADLKASTAVKAMFWMSSSAMHVTWRKNLPVKSASCVRLKISREKYAVLCRYIRNTFDLKNNKPVYIVAPSYGKLDAFYEAKGTYNLFETCNVWTGNGLKEAGVRVAVWTPFEKSVMRQLPQAEF